MSLHFRRETYGLHEDTRVVESLKQPHRRLYILLLLYNIGHTLFSHHDDYLTDAMRLRRDNILGAKMS